MSLPETSNDGQISELLAEISGMKDKLKEMGAGIYQCQLKLKEKGRYEEVLKQANIILQKEMKLEEAVDKVQYSQSRMKWKLPLLKYLSKKKK